MTPRSPVHARGREGLRGAPRLLAAVSLAGLLLLGPAVASAQEPGIRGYALNVATGALEGPFTPSGLSDLTRARLMADGSSGPVDLDVAWETLLRVATEPELLSGVAGLGVVSTGTDWLPLQGTIASGDHAAWTHRVDRLAASVAPSGGIEVTAGRQAISWATTLLFTPADPFAPFDPAEPFREYRAGVDALRLHAFPGTFTELDFVLRPADTQDGTTLTALGRVFTVVGRGELSGWAGVLHDDPAVSAAATWTVGGTALRLEAVIARDPRRGSDDDAVARLAIGADRSFAAWGRDLYVALEYQRDGYGATGATGLLAVATSVPYARGEMQALGRDELAAQLRWQAHPLVSLELLVLGNAGDGSALLSPALSWSASDEATVRTGLFAGLGSNRASTGLPGSEYGPTPTFLYLSGSIFF